MQVGGRTSRYQLSFQEPWFLNRPYTLGFSLFRTDVDFGGTLRSTSEGGGVLLGKQLKPFMAARLGYSYESATSTAFNVTGNTFDSATNRISSLTPSFIYDRVNNPYRPSRGSQLTLSFQVAGGPAGGDTSFLKPIGRFTTYRPKWAPGRSFLAIHGEAGLVREWSDGTILNSASINGVPRFQRFWLGGDTIGPRVFETRTITPLRYVAFDPVTDEITGVTGDPSFLPIDSLITSGGVPALVEVGGDRFYLLQAEWVFPLNQQADIALFVDAGDALFEDQSWGFDTARVAAGVELRFHLPVFPVPLRLIYGWPIRSLQFDRTSRFTFSIGRSF
jgi:outer membrane protein insertion porin family